MSERVSQGPFERLRGFFIGLSAPFVFLFAGFLAIPDLFRYMRMRSM